MGLGNVLARTHFRKEVVVNGGLEYEFRNMLKVELLNSDQTPSATSRTLYPRES